MADIALESKDYYLGAEGQVLIRKKDLIEPLLKDKDHVISNLSQISPISLDHISIDENGNIIVTDANFRAATEAALQASISAGVNMIAVCDNMSCVLEA
jgi:hypothetical protein